MRRPVHPRPRGALTTARRVIIAAAVAAFVVTPAASSHRNAAKTLCAVDSYGTVTTADTTTSTTTARRLFHHRYYVPPTYSGCGSYDWQVSPSYSGDYYADNTSADAAEPPPPSPVTPSLPTWRNLYDWPNGHGYAGWHTASSSQSGAYGMQSALGGNYGLWLWPVGGSSYSYSQGQYAEWTYTAPGTTRITNATLQFTYKNKLLAHHCIDVGFRDASGVVITHNEHCTPVQPPDSQRDVTISLVDPAANPTSTTLYFRIRVDCGGATTCSKNIPQLSPLSTGGYARATKVDMTLVDDDNPEAWASGSFYDLAGDYTNGSSRFDLTFGANDAGSGVQRVWVERIGAGVIASSNAPCDPTHHTDALDNRICPDQYSAGITIDTSTMPEGRNQYFVAASDLAGNTDAQDPWSVSIDRTAPDAALAAATEWYDAQNGDWAVNWDIGTDPPLADGNSGSGVAQSRYRYSLNGGAFSDWETDPGAELVIANARVGDRVTVEVQNLDGVDNATAATSTTLTLDGTAAAPPQEDAALPDFCKDSADSNTCTTYGGGTSVVLMSARAATAYPPVTRSYYEHYLDPKIYRDQGCNVARSKARGLVILAFGRPAYAGGRYGTILVSVRTFASSTAIRKLSIAFAAGFVRCGGARRGSIIVAVGANNSCSLNDPKCKGSLQPPSFNEAGKVWNANVNALGSWIQLKPARRRAVSAAGADDTEPAWEGLSKTAVHTMDFNEGYNAAPFAALFYDFGSNEQGFWSDAIRYRLAYGLPRNYPIPQIYLRNMADPWHDTSKWGAQNGRYGKIRFQGVLSQYNPGVDNTPFGPNCGLSPHDGYDRLLEVLNVDPATALPAMNFISNIVCTT